LGNFLDFSVKWLKDDNLWSVVTGGTDGISLECSKQLAAKGFSLMIISRNEDKLKAVGKSIKNNAVIANKFVLLVQILVLQAVNIFY
jgi:short-subunit dehydrogenase